MRVGAGVDHVVDRGVDRHGRRRRHRLQALGSFYRGGERGDGARTNVSEIGRFGITGVRELGEGRLEALHIAEKRDGGFIRSARAGLGGRSRAVDGAGSASSRAGEEGGGARSRL